MRRFADMLKKSTNLTKVEANFRPVNQNSEASLNFLEEVQFYTDNKSGQINKAQQAEERMKSCDTEAMFQQMFHYLENKESNGNMPVRKFFNNSFGQILNDAIFALKKKQLKSTGEEAAKLQYHEAQIQFVAAYILKKLPDGELHGAISGQHNDEQ